MTSRHRLEQAAIEAMHRGHRSRYQADPELSASDLRTILSVYADQLQLDGDPRGEIIALDLHGVNDGSGRRSELTTAWLGQRIAGHPSISTTDGLISVAVSDGNLELLSDLLASPGAAYIECLSLHGSRDLLVWAIESLSAARLPWLSSLSLRLTGDCVRPVPRDAMLALIDGAPGLTVLEVTGNGLLADCPHPGLLRLVVEGWMRSPRCPARVNRLQLSRSSIWPSFTRDITETHRTRT